jgi:hypothetical protein
LSIGSKSSAREVIEVDDDSSSDDNDILVGRSSLPARIKAAPPVTAKSNSTEDSLWNSDSENEFQG